MWANHKWKGSLFDKRAKAADFLSQYSHCFSSVEGNTTFYGVPDQERLSTWKESVPSHFKFCFKVPRSISHGGNLTSKIQEMNRFWDVIRPFGNNLGPCYLQLPPGYDDLVDLTRFLVAVSSGNNLAVEVRHPQFFAQNAFENDFNQILTDLNITRVLFFTQDFMSQTYQDPALEECKREKPRVTTRWLRTSNTPFIRYIGHPSPGLDEPGLKHLADGVASFCDQGYQPFVFMHQAPADLDSPQIAKLLWDLLQARLPGLEPLCRFPGESLQLKLF